MSSSKAQKAKKQTASGPNGPRKMASKRSTQAQAANKGVAANKHSQNKHVPKKASTHDADQLYLTKPHIEDAVVTRLLRDTYSRERHYFLLRMIIVFAVLLAMSISTNVWLSTKPVEFRYFATDTEGRIQPLVALDQPIMSINEILNWVTNSVTQTYTFSFANYRQELQAAQNNFTPAGWRGFERALEQSRILNTVIDNRFVTTAVPTGAPVVVAEGLVNGRYAWRIQIPIMVTFQSANRNMNQSLMITTTVLRRSETEHPKGLGIAQIIAE